MSIIQVRGRTRIVSRGQGPVGPRGGIGGIVAPLIWIAGRPSDAELVFSAEFADTVTFPEDLTGSLASAENASTGAAIFSLWKGDVNSDGAQWAAATFNVSKSGVYTAASETVFAPSDILRCYAPSPRDATISGIRLTLRGFCELLEG